MVDMIQLLLPLQPPWMRLVDGKLQFSILDSLRVPAPPAKTPRRQDNKPGRSPLKRIAEHAAAATAQTEPRNLGDRSSKWSDDSPEAWGGGGGAREQLRVRMRPRRLFVAFLLCKETAQCPWIKWGSRSVSSCRPTCGHGTLSSLRCGISHVHARQYWL